MVFGRPQFIKRGWRDQPMRCARVANFLCSRRKTRQHGKFGKRLPSELRYELGPSCFMTRNLFALLTKELANYGGL